MVKVPEFGREHTGLRKAGEGMTASEADAWFVREILPLEAALMQFLRHNWRDRGDVEDLRQEIYARVYGAAKKEIPQAPKAFLFTTARNLLINLSQKANVIPIDAMADLDALGIELDAPSPDRSVAARQELRRLQDALDQLPPRHREAIILGRIEGLSGREIAHRMGIAETTASQHLKLGMMALTEFYLRDTPRRRT